MSIWQHNLQYYTNCVWRYLDPVGTSICDTQKLHILTSTSYSGNPTKGCQDPPRMGLEHWQAAAQGTKGHEGYHQGLKDFDRGQHHLSSQRLEPVQPMHR